METAREIEEMERGREEDPIEVVKGKHEGLRMG